MVYEANNLLLTKLLTLYIIIITYLLTYKNRLTSAISVLPFLQQQCSTSEKIELLS